MSNNVAVDMYKQLGYVIYRRVLEYYSGDPDEDAYGEELFIIVALHAHTYMNHIELKQELLDIVSSLNLFPNKIFLFKETPNV